MSRRKFRYQRTLRLEQLEVRRNWMVYVPEFIPAGVSDDVEVVKVDSTDNKLSILANDGYAFYNGRSDDKVIDIALSRKLASVHSISVEGDSLSQFPNGDQPEVFAERKILSVTTPKHGKVRIAEDRLSLFYSPDSAFEGVDQFDYVVDGESSENNKASVSVNVVQPLLAVDDWFLSKPSDASLDLNVLKNDQLNASAFIDDNARRLFKIVAVTTPDVGGTVHISDDGRSLVYSAAAGFEGIERFAYTLEDKDGYRDTAEVSIRATQSTTASESAWPEQVRQQWLDEVIQRNAYQFGQGVGRFGYYPMPFMSMGPNFALSDDASVGRASESDASTSSNANNQVAGVDEGDIVETDGRYLYLFSRASNRNLLADVGAIAPDRIGNSSPIIESNELVIIDAIDPKSPVILSRLGFSGRLIAQHLSGDRLVIITETSSETVKTVVTLVDIADRISPKIVGSSAIDGNFKQSRMIGDKLYLFTSAYLQAPSIERFESSDGLALFYETGRQFLTRLGDKLYDGSLIQVTNFDEAGKQIGKSIDSLTLDEALKIIRGSGIAQGIYSFDVDASQIGPFDIDTIASGYSPTLFVSSDAAYYFDTRWDAFIDNMELGRLSTWGLTQVTNFSFDPADGSVELAATGNIPGILLNSFSVGQHNGDLQVFTSVGPEGTQLSILRREGPTLKVIGSIEGIAPGESIYSARLAGDRAYVVTFQRVDPLFVLDLSNPTDPTIAGELKLPGYSQYLHTIDATHLLGIGRDADEQSGRFGSLQVSLFDVSDISNPILQSSYQFDGGRRTFSPLLEGAFGLSDHLALGYFAAAGVLALPLSHYHDWNGPSNDDGTEKADELPEVGVLRIDTLTGITSLGGVQSPTPINRTMQFGEYLYSIAHDRVIVTDLLAPAVRHAELVLTTSKLSNEVDPSKGEGNSGSDGTIQIEIVKKPIEETTSKGPIAEEPLAKRWHNRENRFDVNGDGFVAPIDVLNVINFLKSHGSGSIAELEQPMLDRQKAQGLLVESIFQVDVNGDGDVAPIDVLLVINHLRTVSQSNAEGESASANTTMTNISAANDSIGVAIPDFETPLRKRPR